MSDPLLQLTGVSKKYVLGDQTFYALRDVYVGIGPGEFVAIVGASGSGKSTFLHIASLLDKPSEGDVFVKGKQVTQYSESEAARLRNKEIGFIFQQFNLLPKTSAVENVALPLVYAGVSEAKRNRLAKEMLTQVGLGDRFSNSPAQLSGGQQQRVAIARALINEPSIIFADEPTGNLDSTSGEEIVKILIELNRKGKTVVIVTHDPDLAKITKRVITLRDGKVLKDEKRNR
jgi:putative ABC transport system ATP-binding protein